MTRSSHNITHLLREWSAGDQRALETLTPLVYEELRKQAARYLRRERPSYAAIEWLNLQLPARSRPLVVGGTETYWFTHPVRGGGNFDGPRMTRYLESLALPEQLRGDRITHVAVIAAAIPTSHEQKHEERQTHLTPAAQQMLVATLNRNARSVTSRGDGTVAGCSAGEGAFTERTAWSGRKRR